MKKAKVECETQKREADQQEKIESVMWHLRQSGESPLH
jgi:hypothetical protein